VTRGPQYGLARNRDPENAQEDFSADQNTEVPRQPQGSPELLLKEMIEDGTKFWHDQTIIGDSPRILGGL
jgi:hypothetical protein